MQQSYKPPGSLTVVSKQGNVTHKDTAQLNLVPEIEGKQNKGFYYGVVLEHEERPVQVARGSIVADGFAVQHRTANHYIVTVIAGSGTIRIHRDEGSEDCPLAAGDVAVLPPNALHEWISGTERLEFVGVELLS